MVELYKSFVRKENGAVTVDWVALTAVGIAVLVTVFSSMSDGTLDTTDATANYMGSWEF
jgi:Flp pilus assembly pilin Flp